MDNGAYIANLLQELKGQSESALGFRHSAASTQAGQDSVCISDVVTVVFERLAEELSEEIEMVVRRAKRRRVDDDDDDMTATSTVAKRGKHSGALRTKRVTASDVTMILILSARNGFF
ncbi:hypothetical protein V491_00676 [Pseudogymnoascus sp. VKM F-3775]|nr:hypothetical protein V491_00676 [Pseudogymnoascus sp. VKM F-3775]